MGKVASEELKVWNLPPEVTNHAGQPISADAVFFAPPPAEIGKILSADSTMALGKSLTYKKTFFQRFGRFLRFNAWIMAGVALVLSFLLVFGWLGLLIFLALTVGPFLSLHWLANALLRHQCTYVGKDGIARFSWDPKTAQAKPDGLVLFSRTGGVSVNVTRQNHYSSYYQTDYTYAWSDKNNNDQKLLTIQDFHVSESNVPPGNNPYYFALAGEKAWDDYKFEQAWADLTVNGSVTFTHYDNYNFDPGASSYSPSRNPIVVTPKFLDVTYRGDRAQCNFSDIRQATICSGILTIQQRVADPHVWVDGVYTVDTKYIADAKILLRLLDSLIDLQDLDAAR
jgi:hypothetical protein